jgi:hypothetical protein
MPSTSSPADHVRPHTSIADCETSANALGWAPLRQSALGKADGRPFVLLPLPARKCGARVPLAKVQDADFRTLRIVRGQVHAQQGATVFATPRRDAARAFRLAMSNH